MRTDLILKYIMQEVAARSGCLLPVILPRVGLILPSLDSQLHVTD